MVALIVGILFVGFTVFAALPQGLHWGAEIILFLKGFTPIFLGFLGAIAIFIGIADIKDKQEVKKEEEASRNNIDIK